MLKDYARERIREAEEAVRQRKRVQELGDYIHGLARWDRIATFSFRHARSSESAFGGVEAWAEDVQEAARQPIGWAIAQSRGEVGRARHVPVVHARGADPRM